MADTPFLGSLAHRSTKFGSYDIYGKLTQGYLLIGGCQEKNLHR